MMNGSNFVGPSESREGTATLQAWNPATGDALTPLFCEATSAEVDCAARAAEAAFAAYSRLAPAERARFLRAIGEKIVGLGDALL